MPEQIKRFLRLAMIILFASAACNPARPSAPRETLAPATLIAPLQPLLAETPQVLALSPAGPVPLYYEGRVGQIISLEVIPAEGTTSDPVVTLIGPDGRILAYADDTRDTNHARIIRLLLPQDGTYRILVHSFSGVDTGDVTVRLWHEEA